MAHAIHEIDPLADTVLILHNAGSAFAVWDEAAKPDIHYDEWRLWGPLTVSKKTKKGKKGKKGKAVVQEAPLAPLPIAIGEVNNVSNGWDSIFGNGSISQPDAGPSTFSQPLEPATSQEPQSLEVDISAEPGKPAEKEATWEPEPAPAPVMVESEVAPPAEVTPKDEGGIHYLVSSRHLALASGSFKSSLSRDGWIEGQPSEKDGRYRLTATDWDSQALLILTNILHLQNDAVPRTITLEMLAKVAVLVYDYRCRQAVSVFAEIWIDKVRITHPVPDKYGRDLILWMFISWVFKLPNEFKETTAIAIRQCDTATVRNMNIPLPPLILEAIEHERYRAVENVISTLHAWLGKFRKSTFQCPDGDRLNFTCTSILLGALTKEMDVIECFHPRPELPFEGRSFEELTSKVRAMQSPSWADPTGGRYHSYHHNYAHSCSLETTVGAAVNAISISGLNLRDFKDRGEGE